MKNKSLHAGNDSKMTGSNAVTIFDNIVTMIAPQMKAIINSVWDICILSPTDFISKIYDIKIMPIYLIVVYAKVRKRVFRVLSKKKRDKWEIKENVMKIGLPVLSFKSDNLTYYELLNNVRIAMRLFARLVYLRYGRILKPCDMTIHIIRRYLEPYLSRFGEPHGKEIMLIKPLSWDRIEIVKADFRTKDVENLAIFIKRKKMMEKLKEESKESVIRKMQKKRKRELKKIRKMLYSLSLPLTSKRR